MERKKEGKKKNIKFEGKKLKNVDTIFSLYIKIVVFSPMENV